MPAKDLGVKYACFKCGTKFYDLKKPPICPKCGADQRESASQKSPPPAERRSRTPARVAVEPAEDLKLEGEPELEEELDEVTDEDAADDDDDDE